MTVTDRPHIDYAPARKGRERRGIARVVIGSLLLAAIVVGSWMWGPAACERIKLLYWQRGALEHAAGADQIVFDNDPSRIRTLVSANGFEEAQWTAPPSVFAPDRAWQNFNRLYSPPGRRDAPVLFVHERRNSRGEARLVVVERGWPERTLGDPSGRGAYFVLSCLVIRPGSALAAPLELSDSAEYVDANARPVTLTLRWYAGQCDPADDSHFTVDFQFDGKPGVLDGWLLDSDTVRLRVRGAVSVP